MRIASLVGAAMLSATAAAKTDTVFIGVDSSTPSSDAAILVINEPEASKSGVKTLVMYFGPDGDYAGTATKRAHFAVVKPGRYRFMTKCTFTRWESLVESVADLEGGVAYSVRCTGRTSHKLRVVIEPLKDPLPR